jgi:hypothetical protein
LEFGIGPAVCSRTIFKAEIALNQALRSLPEARIKWPSKEEQRSMALLVERKDPRIKGRFFFVDGKNLHVMEPSDSEYQNALYNGWLHSVLITGCLCFLVDGTIGWAKHNCPGSWNDGEISRPLQEMICDSDLTLEGHGGFVYFVSCYYKYASMC